MADFLFPFFQGTLIVLALLILFCAIRAVIGPRTADRLLAVNMITTLVIVSVCILSLLLSESYLTDVALLFSLLGPLAVITLTRLLAQKIEKKHAADSVPARSSGGIG